MADNRPTIRSMPLTSTVLTSHNVLIALPWLPNGAWLSCDEKKMTGIARDQ